MTPIEAILYLSKLYKRLVSMRSQAFPDWWFSNPPRFRFVSCFGELCFAEMKLACDKQGHQDSRVNTEPQDGMLLLSLPCASCSCRIFRRRTNRLLAVTNVVIVTLISHILCVAHVTCSLLHRGYVRSIAVESHPPRSQLA